MGYFKLSTNDLYIGMIKDIFLKRFIIVLCGYICFLWVGKLTLYLKFLCMSTCQATEEGPAVLLDFLIIQEYVLRQGPKY